MFKTNSREPKTQLLLWWAAQFLEDRANGELANRRVTINQVKKTEAKQLGELSPLWEDTGRGHNQFRGVMKKATGYMSPNKRVLNSVDFSFWWVGGRAG